MFGWFKKKPRTEREAIADQVLEMLKSFKAEDKTTRELFLHATGVLHANFLGEYKSVEQFKMLPEREKGQYFVHSRVIPEPRLRDVPAVKFAYVYYSTLIHCQVDEDRSRTEKLRAAYGDVIQDLMVAKRRR